MEIRSRLKSPPDGPARPDQIRPDADGCRPGAGAANACPPCLAGLAMGPCKGRAGTGGAFQTASAKCNKHRRGIGPFPPASEVPPATPKHRAGKAAVKHANQ